MSSSLIASSVADPEESLKNVDDDQEEKSTVLDGENVIFYCIYHDDQSFLLKALSDHSNAYYESATSLLNVRNSEGKSPLDMACMLGRVNILKLLIKHGADLSSSTPSGYFPAHFAACWGHRDCLEALLESGYRFDIVTKRNESLKELALRYNHAICVEYIDWAESDYEAQLKKAQADKKKSHHKKKKH